MVYIKSDGSFGGSWQKQLDFLKREKPNDLNHMLYAKLALLQRQEPERADYYEFLSKQLTQRISEAWNKNPEFGFDDAQVVTQEFITELHLEALLEDAPQPEPRSYWCPYCEDFIPHKSMENGNTYCVACSHERTLV